MAILQNNAARRSFCRCLQKKAAGVVHPFLNPNALKCCSVAVDQSSYSDAAYKRGYREGYHQPSGKKRCYVYLGTWVLGYNDCNC